MSHELSGTFQYPIEIGDLSASKEPHIDMSCEHVDVAESRIPYAGSRMSVVQ